ncbi:MAG TPA: phosphate ABC transporter permease subunit PstC [Armatimonadota bacterium]|nr:phosphate ABC transporter permease subunit PstC [Armatimonadota bacterium]
MTTAQDPSKTRRRRVLPGGLSTGQRFHLFEWTLVAFAFSIVLVTVLTLFILFKGAWPAIVRYGPAFVVHQYWDPVSEHFGALTYIFGTIVTSALALLFSVGVSICAALYLAEMAPRWLRAPFSFVVELLAAVPSVVYGLWGLLVMAPWLYRYIESPLNSLFPRFPLFGGTPRATSLFTAGVLLAIMISPFITAVSRDVILSASRTLKEGSIGLGATHWEAIWTLILPASSRGIFGAVVLGLGRAMGETMAVTMVVGNTPQIKASLFAPGYTLGSVLVNEFTEASIPIYLSALMELGLLLFAVSVLMNAAARILVGRMAR